MDWLLNTTHKYALIVSSDGRFFIKRVSTKVRITTIWFASFESLGKIYAIVCHLGEGTEMFSFSLH